MERAFLHSSPSLQNHVSLELPEIPLTSSSSMLRSLETASHGFPRPPIDTMVNTHNEFPTGTFPAQLFCSIIQARPNLQCASIVRLDWLEAKKWPLYHQYLLVEIAYNNRLYAARIETLGKFDRSRAALQILALNTLGTIGFLGNGKFQVQVWKLSPDSSIDRYIELNSANLIASMASVDDRLFNDLVDEFSNPETWYFTSVAPPDFSEVDSRETPKLKHICLILSSVLQRAPNYHLVSQNCYFLCRTTIRGLSGLCAPFPRLTWSLHARYLHACSDVTEVPWYRLLWSPNSQFLPAPSCVFYIGGTPADHLRQILHEFDSLVRWNFMDGFMFSVLAVGILVSIPLLVAPNVFRSWLGLITFETIYCIALFVVLRWVTRRWRCGVDQLHEVKNSVLKDIGVIPTRQWSFSPGPDHWMFNIILPHQTLLQSLFLVPLRIVMFPFIGMLWIACSLITILVYILLIPVWVPIVLSEKKAKTAPYYPTHY